MQDVALYIMKIHGLLDCYTLSKDDSHHSNERDEGPLCIITSSEFQAKAWRTGATLYFETLPENDYSFFRWFETMYSDFMQPHALSRGIQGSSLGIATLLSGVPSSRKDQQRISADVVTMYSKLLDKYPSIVQLPKEQVLDYNGSMHIHLPNPESDEYILIKADSRTPLTLDLHQKGVDDIVNCISSKAQGWAWEKSITASACIHFKTEDLAKKVYQVN